MYLFLTILTILTCLGFGVAAPANLTMAGPSELKARGRKPTNLEVWTDIVVFQKSIEDFESIRDSRLGVEGMIFEANGCSGVADRPFGWDCTYILTHESDALRHTVEVS